MQRIDSSRLESFGMVIASFSRYNKEGKSQFSKNTSLLADIRIDVAFGITFLTLNNIKINRINHRFQWGLYIIAKAILTIKWVEQIGKKEFAIADLNFDDKTSVILIVSLTSSNRGLDVHL